MHVPSDRTLAQWIRELIREDTLYRFYKTPEWRSLRRYVLKLNHFECKRCIEKSPAIYNKAVTVHHVNEVRDRPDLALSFTYIDANGIVRVNLEALCNGCHNAEHDRFSAAEDRPQLNIERW